LLCHFKADEETIDLHPHILVIISLRKTGGFIFIDVLSDIFLGFYTGEVDDIPVCVNAVFSRL
jgi:hypothetical protein